MVDWSELTDEEHGHLLFLYEDATFDRVLYRDEDTAQAVDHLEALGLIEVGFNGRCRLSTEGVRFMANAKEAKPWTVADFIKALSDLPLDMEIWQQGVNDFLPILDDTFPNNESVGLFVRDGKLVLNYDNWGGEHTPLTRSSE